MKKLLLVLAPLLVLACICPIPAAVTGSTPRASPTSLRTEVIPSEPAATVRPADTQPSPSVTASSDVPAAPQVDLVMVRLHPGTDKLEDQLSAEVRRAAALGRKPFVEFDAAW